MNRKIRASTRIILMFNVFVFFSPDSAGQAEVPTDTEGERSVCRQYLDFLDGDDPSNLNGCDEAEAWVIQNWVFDYGEFIQSYIAKASPRSATGAAVRAVQVAIRGDAKSTILFAEVADRYSFYVFSSRGDHERAVLYSSQVSKLKYNFIESICTPSEACRDISANPEISELLGTNFINLDSIRPEFAILCLLWVDSFNVPVREVIGSKRFNMCLEEK